MPALKLPQHKDLGSQHKAIGSISDREMAIDVANYIIGLERDLTTFIEDRIELKFHKGKAHKAAREEHLAKQRDRVLRAIGHSIDSSSMIRAIHREFLEGEGSWKDAN
jgi:hypothetical protein